MRVSGLDSNGDWRFGRGKAVHLTGSDAVAQNVVTRLRSFTDDWFLDVRANIDWFGLLGTRGVTVAQIRREVERVTLATLGVARIDALSVEFDRAARQVTINLTLTTLYGIQESLQVPL